MSMIDLANRNGAPDLKPVTRALISHGFGRPIGNRRAAIKASCKSPTSGDRVSRFAVSPG